MASKKLFTVCLDFDGVVADTAALKRHWLGNRLSLSLDSCPVDRSSLLSWIDKDTYEEMQKSVGFADTMLAAPIDGALEAILSLSQSVDFVLLSARPPEKIVWAREWMRSYGLLGSFSSVFSSYRRSKKELAHLTMASWLVDDDARHLSDLPRGLRGVHFGGSPALTDVLHPVVVKSWAELVSILRVD